MAKSLDEVLAGLEPARRRKIEERASQLIAEELSLRELRKARELTQAQVAATLGITQDGVSRLEKRSDLLISTLRKTIKAMGGDLKLVASFPDQAPVELSGISDTKF
ncbi:MAG: XRE family transcriptional regulator [Gammaproteobacteria bacterium]|nr:XRE family transcriptional regulator [Gammaproteobacteria bacterium]